MRAPTSHRITTLLPALLASVAAAAERGDEPLTRVLSKRASGTWSQTELRVALRRLSDAFDCPIWLDRRVDPTTPLELAVRPTSLASVINQIAEASGLGATRVGALVYVGPSAGALADRPVARSAALRRAGVLKWERLAAPRALIERVADNGRVRIVNADAIPHDLWEAGAWPRLSNADQLTLLLVGFGLTWSPDPADANRVRITRLPHNAESRLARLRTPRRVLTPAATTEHHAINVQEKPLELVAQQLAAAFGMRIRFEASVTAAKRSQRVTFRVRDATSLEVLEALAAAGGLRAQSEGDTVVIGPAPVAGQ